jgi:5-methylcytosine-specific restriction endonuclease McrA
MSIRYELEPLHRNTPDVEFLDDLKRVAAKLGATTVSMSQYNQFGRFHASSLVRRFGSWNRALKRSGLGFRNANVTEEELFNNLVEVWAHFGRQPRYEELTAQTSRISRDTYMRRFGGWRKALEAFVRWANETERPAVPRTAARSDTTRHRTPRNINYRLRFLVMRRDNFKCRITGRSPATDPTVILEVDHIVPWEKGGETEFDNLQTLAKDVNIGKSNLEMSSDG